ncbi:MAG: methyltransferase domain-containing protein [Eubacteriales bacterium]|nr:methyltransferase domain-containing protein [Eubacteriales bacterium]
MSNHNSLHLPVAICTLLNRLFRLPVHPFNLQSSGFKTYAEWQFDKGSQTIRFFLEKFSPDEIYMNKVLLDIGCGAAGKSLYYAASGAAFVYGADIVTSYMEEALRLARAKNLSDKFCFLIADAASLPLDSGSIDTVIMNDAMEHVADPEKVIAECARVLKPGGRLFINFPPYYHPYGAHLSDLIGIPWAHLLFSEKTLVRTYIRLASSLPDGDRRVALRMSRGDTEDLLHPATYEVKKIHVKTHHVVTPHIAYINKMTINRFNKLLLTQKLFLVEYRHDVPLRSFLKLPARLPVLKEALTKMSVAVLQKIPDLRPTETRSL